MACYGVLLLLSLAGAPQMVRGLGPALAPASAPIGPGRGGKGTAYAAHPPTISLSIDPAALAPYAEVESPVVFPGYLLPDDGCEEPAHAGS
jgi:hypothetical protein